MPKVPGFKRLLASRYGGLFAAWRNLLDTDRKYRVTLLEFSNACREVGTIWVSQGGLLCSSLSGASVSRRVVRTCLYRRERDQAYQRPHTMSGALRAVPRVAWTPAQPDDSRGSSIADVEASWPTQVCSGARAARNRTPRPAAFAPPVLGSRREA